MASLFTNNRDTMANEAAKRRQLEGNTNFALLGEPIQKLLLRINRDVSNELMGALAKVSVRLLAQVFDMLTVDEDPNKILDWLDREIHRQTDGPRPGPTPNPTPKRKHVVTDAIGLFREMEKKNMEMMEHFRQAQEDRESKRKNNIAQRRKAQEEAAARAAEERAKAEEAGIKHDARDSMSKQDRFSIINAFQRATKNSAVDNSEKQGDTEWWKSDEFRKDFEKHGKKGSQWNRAVPGGSAVAPEAELASREAWYKQAAWWKAEKYKKNWQATKDAEWWKEETYIRDWQDNGEKGAKWTAIDELAGFNKKGDRRPASKVELAQRVEWYKNNGPKGTVKEWCALIEGSKDRCTLDEKREREVYYRSGDWWKSDKCQRALKENPTTCEALKFAGAAGEDREWWKDERFRKDFDKGGEVWRSANEKSAVMGGGDHKCTEAEMKKRKEWFTDHWWKADEYAADFKANGDKGSKWRARTKADSTGAPGAKMCRESEAKDRAEWFKSAEDREWWKDDALLRDFTENGEKGKKWKAAYKEAAIDGCGDEAAADEIAKRKKWFDDNWWKADRYVKDFQTQGSKGSAWKIAKKNAEADSDWWKSGDYMKKFKAGKKADATPFWQDADAIADYNANGSSGKKWCAKHAAAASVDRGQEEKAPADELAAREDWLKKNFWRDPECVADYAAHGSVGKKWTAKEKGSGDKCDNDEMKKRLEVLNPKEAVPAAYDAMFEADAHAKTGGDAASPEEIIKRQERLLKDWWKAPAIREDFENGEKGHVWKANCPETAALGTSSDPENQASAAELADRKKWLEAGKPDEEFWTSDACRKEFATKNREPEFWKNPESIADYQANGASGKKWKANDASAAAAGRDEPADEATVADREDWLKKNFWKAPKYQEDFLKNGEKGTLWTTTQPDGKGTTAPDEELKARAAHFKPNARWQMKNAPTDDQIAANSLATCSTADAQDREEWFKKNWWKSPEVKADWEKNGKKGKLFKAKTAEAAEMGLGDQPEYQATPEELDEREEYFETAGDEQDWWKDPNMIEDFLANGKDGAKWTARNAKDAAQNLGVEQPAPSDELENRGNWFKKNFWKAPDSIEDYKKSGDSGKKWKKKGQDDEAPLEPSSEELRKRRNWMEKHAPADSGEIQKRKEWFEKQLTDEEKIHRRKWIAKQADEEKKIHVDELADLLAQINDGHEATPEQLEAIARYVKNLKQQEGNHDQETISQEEFISAVAETALWMPPSEEERLRAEQELIEEMLREQMEQEEEEIAYEALMAEEELEKAGTTYEEMQDSKTADEEEAAYLAAQEAEEQEAAIENEDDQEWDEEAWNQYMEEQAAVEAAAGDDEEEGTANHDDECEDEALFMYGERMAAEQAALEEIWASEELGEEDGTYEDADATIDEEQMEQLEDVIEEADLDVVEEYDDYDDDDYDNVLTPQQQEDEEVVKMLHTETGLPLQWKLPLPEVTNPHFLKSYFTVLKFTPNTGIFSGAQKRVWVVDHFTRTFYNLDNSGKIKKEHAANKLLQLERNIVDPNRLRLMFFDSSHSYELQFFSPLERERFFETAQAIRPSIRVYAPDLTNQDVNVEACTTTIDGVGPNTVSVVAPNATGKPVKRELTGECKINASKLLTEPVTIWTGTFNLSGKPPPRNQAELNTWIPKDKYDIYAVACQEASFRKDEGEWFEYIQRHLGRDYLSLASMSLWDSLLIVLAKKKHLLKITCVEGSTKATQHKQVCGTKGGIGISLRFLETSFAFVTCQLAARVERTQMRNTNVEEIVDGLQLGIHETDFLSQFNHVFFFGDFNYRLELDSKAAMEKIEAQDYATLLINDQLTVQKAEHGMFAGFEEPPITFPPTYRMVVGPQGAGKYQAEKGNAPSYCDRVLTRSMSNTWIKCTSYSAAPKVTTSEHQPVAATFITRCVRPTLSCFMKSQAPIPLFNFMEVNVVQSPGVIIKKPQLLTLSPMTARTNAVDAKAGGTQNPQFDGRQSIKLLSVTQCQEYLETCHFIFIIRDGTEKRADKAHRGTAVMPLFGKMLGMEGVPQDIDCEILCHGKLCGRLTGKWIWTAAAAAAAAGGDQK